MAIEFVELIRTDRQFQIKVGGITAAVLSGVLLAGKGRKYNSIILRITYPKHYNYSRRVKPTDRNKLL